MMNYLTAKQQFAIAVSSEFPDLNLEIESIEYGGTITAFFASFETSEALLTLWDDLSSFIAFNFQSCLEDEFQRWNLYVFYVVSGNVDKALKYKIENDPISSRKIVIENTSSIDQAKLISEHITNENIRLNTSRNSAITFEKDLTIWNALRTMPDVKKRKELDMHAENVLTQLAKVLKDEI